MRQPLLLLVLVFCAVLIPTALVASVPPLLNYQGTLRDNLGELVPDGNYSVTFRIWDSETSGNAVWQEGRLVAVQDGLFTVLLGSIVPIPDSLFESPDRWIGLQVGLDAEMSPRQRLVSVPFAWQSLAADMADTARAAKSVDTSGFSAYLDLQSEERIGDQPWQVATGDHNHDPDSALIQSLRPFVPVSALNVSDNTTFSTTSSTFVTARTIAIPPDSLNELVVRFNLRPISSSASCGSGRCRARVLFGAVNYGEVLSPMTNPDCGGYTAVFALKVPPPMVASGGDLQLQIRVDGSQDAHNDYWEVWGR